MKVTASKIITLELSEKEAKFIKDFIGAHSSVLQVRLRPSSVVCEEGAKFLDDLFDSIPDNEGRCANVGHHVTFKAR
jgi:hypothetical protein